MCDKLKTTVLFIALIAVATPLHGHILLIDERPDAQEITEVRFDVPYGCVITGLGFRAHYDNITTMHCRYHRLLPNGTLVEPTEIHLGAEPDHACEGKVLLPDGWVAVGFGAAGEPEWDVTLVRLWARKLMPNGKLGELKVFSDGFKPDRGPERFVLPNETNRVLTGAGLRFHFNDIIGIYGASKRIVNLPYNPSSKERFFKTQSWFLDEFALGQTDVLKNRILEYGVTRLDVRFQEEVYNPQHLRKLKQLVGPEIFFWVNQTNPQKIAEIFREANFITGIVLDLTSCQPKDRNKSAINALYKTCQSLNLQLCLKADIADPSHRNLVLSMPESITIIIPADSSFEHIAHLRKRHVICEIFLHTPAALANGLPDVRIEETAGRLALAAIARCDGFIAHVGAPNPITDISLDALKRLARNPFESTDDIWNDLCTVHFGKAAPYAESALRRTASANKLTFCVLGLDFLMQDGRLTPLDEVRQRLQNAAKNQNSPLAAKSARALLAPTADIVFQAKLEKETAGWLIRQSLQDSEQTVSTTPSEPANTLLNSVQCMQNVSLICETATLAFMQTQLYSQSADPEARRVAEEYLDNLKETAANLSLEIQQGAILERINQFMDSVVTALSEAEQKSPLATAFRRVRELSAAHQDKKAVQTLAEILRENAFKPYIQARNETIGEIASSLRALWNPQENLRVLRGADGKWQLSKVAGRWCWTTSSQSPCIYFDFRSGPLDPPKDYVLYLEYFDEGNSKIYVQYDSDYPDTSGRQYHATTPVQLSNSKTWKTVSLNLPKCRFGAGQNLAADMRIVSGEQAHIRNVSLTISQP